jgi:hypothetical protein
VGWGQHWKRVSALSGLLILCRQCVCAIFHQDEVEEDEQEDDISKSKNIKQKEVKSVASSFSSKKGK